MALFVFIGHDGPDGTAKRDQYRAAHVAALDKLDAETLDAAKKLMAHDPFVVGGVFASYSVHPFRQAYPK